MQANPTDAQGEDERLWKDDSGVWYLYDPGSTDGAGQHYDPTNHRLPASFDEAIQTELTKQKKVWLTEGVEGNAWQEIREQARQELLDEFIELMTEDERPIIEWYREPFECVHDLISELRSKRTAPTKEDKKTKEVN